MMTIPKFGLYSGALLFAFIQAPSQTSPIVPQLSLSVADTIPVAGTRAAPTMHPLRCDADGNVYLRFYQLQNPFQSPVVRISKDGDSKQAFSLSAVQGFQNADVEAFAVGSDGSVALAVRAPDPKTQNGEEGYVLKFNKDGTFDSDSTVKLGAEVNPEKIALFTSGELLVSGSKEEHLYGTNKATVSVPFTEVIGLAGNVVKNLTLPGDVTPPKPADPDFAAKSTQAPAAITLGDAVSGSDGNVYLARHLAKPVVYVIGPDGSVVRTLHLTLPSSTAHEGAIMQYSDTGGGQLAIPFVDLGPAGTTAHRQIISVYSAQTGERLADYILPPGVGGALACYTTGEYTLLGSTEQHQLALKEVKPS